MCNLNPGRINYSDIAKKFEFSTMAFGCAKGQGASIRYILDIGLKNIRARNYFLTNKLIEGLKNQNARILSPKNENEQSVIVAAKFDCHNSDTLVERLKKRFLYLLEMIY